MEGSNFITSIMSNITYHYNRHSFTIYFLFTMLRYRSDSAAIYNMWPLSAALLLSSISVCFCQLEQQHRYNTTAEQLEFQNETTCNIERCRISPAQTQFRNEHTLDNYLKSSSVIYGLLAHIDDLELNHLCRNHMQSLYESIHKKEIWAMKSKLNRTNLL